MFNICTLEDKHDVVECRQSKRPQRNLSEYEPMYLQQRKITMNLLSHLSKYDAMRDTMSKDNKTNFLLTPTYSSDMMANSQDEKKTF